MNKNDKTINKIMGAINRRTQKRSCSKNDQRPCFFCLFWFLVFKNFIRESALKLHIIFQIRAKPPCFSDLLVLKQQVEILGVVLKLWLVEVFGVFFINFSLVGWIFRIEFV